MSEDVMCGAYANALLVVHSASDFCLDFIANLYPRPVVTARIFLERAAGANPPHVDHPGLEQPASKATATAATAAVVLNLRDSGAHQSRDR